MCIRDRGNPHTELMLIGEAPGYYEEVQQEPFVGRAGEKLNQILKAMGPVSYTHLDVYTRQALIGAGSRVLTDMPILGKQMRCV